MRIELIKIILLRETKNKCFRDVTGQELGVERNKITFETYN